MLTMIFKPWNYSQKSIYKEGGNNMKIYKEEDLINFEFWGGAFYNAIYLTDEEIGIIEGILEETYSEGMTETEINDFFWFEEDIIAEWLGYSSFREIENR